MKDWLKHVGVIISFCIISVVFFAPKLDGKVVNQGDIQHWKGMSKELKDYYEEEGGTSTWLGSMFSGMPSYTVSVYTDIPSATSYLEKAFNAFGNGDCGIVLLSLVTMYILLISLNMPITIAVIGAIAYAFSSYSIIIIGAGHITKAWAMAYIPLVVGGMFMLFKQRLFAGLILFSIALTLELKQNHIQITYYLMFLCLALYIGFLIRSIKERSYRPLAKISGCLALGVVLAVSINSSKLYSNWELSKTSIRGKSELSSSTDGKADKSSGLDQEYAFAWSYGIPETMTLLIPDFYGGASGGELSPSDSNIAKAMRANGYQVPPKLQSYTYWGDQPFTSGPVYFGAIVCFLFVLSLYIVKNKYKWWIVGASAFFFILSWGRNFMAVNDFLFHYLPMYNKFRTPSMALVIPQFTFVLLGCMALYAIWKKEYNEKDLKKALFKAGGITGGLCLLFAVIPSLFLNFSSANDAHMDMPQWYMGALIADRKDLLIADAFRSFMFIALAWAAIWYVIRKKEDKKATYALLAIGVLVLVDLWNVDKRYLNDDHFVSERESTFKPTVADKAILQDKDLSYRVLSLNNPFNDTHASYFHKSIGGYNAAKQRRYQELIDLHITPEMQAIASSFNQIKTEADAQNLFRMTPILNMLNMRYLIYNDNAAPIANPYAYGNAWFVDEVRMVENADEEMSQLGDIDPRRTALVDNRFGGIISASNNVADSLAQIKMVSYKPDKVKYQSSSLKDGVALFSEVYYQPGWKATIDGKEVEHFRANWILRGLQVPAGNHEIEFVFYPETYWFLRWMGAIISILLVGTALVGIVLYFRKR